MTCFGSEADLVKACMSTDHDLEFQLSWTGAAAQKRTKGKHACASCQESEVSMDMSSASEPTANFDTTSDTVLGI